MAVLLVCKYLEQAMANQSDSKPHRKGTQITAYASSRFRQAAALLP
jgi:hypothetical protein